MIHALLLAAVLQVPTQAPQLWPGTRYDRAIPTLEAVVGHDFRSEITSPTEIQAYLRALTAAAPGRTHLIRYAESWEGRPLHMLVIGSPERIARMEEIKADLALLADPRELSDGEVATLVARSPVITALLHSVHGNEVSSSGAAMAEAYHLLAAVNDPVVERIFEESMVIIDPLQNPDGRARFVFQTRMGRAAWPDADPLALEHDEPWPGGRTNHYLFDLNRDWFAQTQPESRGKVRTLLDWNPHVVVDLHEMGGNSTYYFPPAAVPGNPHTTREQAASMEMFGRANADRFDERGFSYFIREVFDAFYPGYGASWPTAQGVIAMTYEQASARGLVFRRRDGTDLSYGDGVLHHFTSAITTAHTAALNREKLLREFVQFRLSATAMGERGTREYILFSEHDPAMAGRLARTLARNGIEVFVTEAPTRAEGRDIPVGAFVVPLSQPSGRLVRNLLDSHTRMDPDFVAEQVRRRAERLSDQIYDVTAWSMPLLWDVESVATTRPTRVAMTRVYPNTPPAAAIPLRRPRVGYLVPWNSAAAAAVAEALRAGIRVHSVGGAFELDGRSYPIGTALIRTPQLRAGERELLGSILEKHAAGAIPIDNAFVDSGTSLGSNLVRPLSEPSVLLVFGRPASVYSAGWARYVLERRYGQRVTAVRASTLPRVNLSDFDVVVLPSGDYSSVFSGAALTGLRSWMERGGTLITIQEASRWAARDGVGLLATHTELRGGAPDTGDGPSEREVPEQPIDLLEAIQPMREAPEQTPGAILRVDLDTTHWLSSGTDGEIGALVEGTRVFTPITLDRGANVGVYATLDRLVASGIVWEEGRPQLASKAFLVHQPVGAGHLIAFAEDPNYRSYSEATQLLFINAVLMGPAR